MSKILPAIAMLVTLAPAAPALAGGDYRHRGFLRPGFADRVVSPGVWEVTGSSSEEKGSVPVALYRLAELASAAGAGEVRIVRQKVKATTVTRRGGGIVSFTEKTSITARAIRSEADRSACEMAEARRCLTLPVAGLLAAYGPALRMPGAVPGAKPATPVQLVTTPTTGTQADMLRAWRRLHPATLAGAPLNGSAGTVSAVPAPIPTPTRVAETPVASGGNAKVVAATGTSFAERLRAAQPLRGREPTLGWTISD